MIRSLPAFARALSVALLAACRVGPNYHAPTLPPGAKAPLVSLDTTAETPQSPPDRWWRLYNDARLDALIEETLKANRSPRAADAHFAAARAILTAVHASRYPSTEASAGGLYGRDAVTDEILELGGHPPQTFWWFDDVVQSAYELDLFGRVHRAIEAANANADAENGGKRHEMRAITTWRLISMPTSSLGHRGRFQRVSVSQHSECKDAVNHVLFDLW